MISQAQLEEAFYGPNDMDEEFIVAMIIEYVRARTALIDTFVPPTPIGENVIAAAKNEWTLFVRFLSDKTNRQWIRDNYTTGGNLNPERTRG